MKIAIIGRTEILFKTAIHLRAVGHTIVCILTAKAAPEYTHTALDFENLALEWEIPFVQGARIGEHLGFLREAGADIGVSVNYPGVIPQAIIDLFPLGIINAHGGDLPRYRGNACQAWAILNGENRVGLCIHKMISGELDSGDIVARDYLQIDHSTKVTKVWEWMQTRTPSLILEAVNKLGNDSTYFLERQSSDPRDALRCYPRRAEDGKIDWNKSAIEILRLINACNKPYHGAFCCYNSEKMIIWDAQLVDEYENFCAIPGQVTRIEQGLVEVACSLGKLRVLCVEYLGVIKSPDYWVRSVRVRFD
jgi:UDP-4-amino-4-deoxy-L-arabinose formyltransferase/UDP-glucuronic acid dehydrogenase (UDP-4-keto-hexauronic acid decarboxylating)